MRDLRFGWWFALLLSCLTVAYGADNRSTALVATADIRSSTWIAVAAPFTGDGNGNSYTTFEIGLSSSGPFNLFQTTYIDGAPSWRGYYFNTLTPAQYIRGKMGRPLFLSARADGLGLIISGS